MEEARRVLLIGVDDSEDSERAYNWALQNLYKDGDEVHLCHVIPRQQVVPPLPLVDYVPMPDTETSERLLKRAELFILDRFVQKLPPQLKLNPIIHIVKGEVDNDNIGNTLCKKAQDLGAACLVLASHNKGRIAEFFLGSVTAYCTHHAKTPVAVIH